MQLIGGKKLHFHETSGKRKSLGISSKRMFERCVTMVIWPINNLLAQFISPKSNARRSREQKREFYDRRKSDNIWCRFSIIVVDAVFSKNMALLNFPIL